jgi:Holliday junction resolvase
MFGKINLTTKSLSSLSLDINNPRLSGYRKQGKLKNEKDIISVMLTNYAIKDLISSILTNGYHPDEILYSIPCETSSRKRIIVEGNRRLTACKILKKPDILKGTKYSYLISRIKNHKNYKIAVDTIKKLNIVELDSRAAARTYIASKHTKESIRRWSVYTQGAYYIDLLGEFKTINELRASINNIVSNSRVKSVIIFSRITDKILELDTLTTEEKELILSDIDNAKVEAILRLIQRSEFREKIGIITLNASGELIIKKISQTAFSYILAKMARDAHFTKELTTRQENDAYINSYINNLVKIAEQFSPPESDFDDDAEEEIDLDLSGNEEDSVDDLTNGTGNNGYENDSDINTNGSPIVTVRKKKLGNYLLSRKTPFTQSHIKIDDLIEESKRLNFIRFKHSAILLSRTLIQIMLSHLIKNSEFNDDYRRKSAFKYLELDSLLDYFSINLNKLFPNEQNPQDIKLIKQTLVSYKESGRIIANLATHHELHILTDQEITHIQAKLQTLVDYFINKIQGGH